MFRKKRTTGAVPDRFVQGIRIKNQSLKIYELDESRFLVVEKKYVLGLRVSYKEEIVNDIYTAEDRITNLKTLRK